jgi:hypothetical protein
MFKSNTLYSEKKNLRAIYNILDEKLLLRNQKSLYPLLP